MPGRLPRVRPMNREYSDSLFPCGIGASFIITLLVFMLGGSLIGVFLAPFLEQENLENAGGIILLLIFLVIVVGPIFGRAIEAEYPLTTRGYRVLKRKELF